LCLGELAGAEVKWSGREDQVFNGRKIQRRAAGLSERGSGLSPTVTVGDGQKDNGIEWGLVTKQLHNLAFKLPVILQIAPQTTNA